jgi:hypothetical protein
MLAQYQSYGRTLWAMLDTGEVYNKNWSTSTVVALAKVIWDSGDFSTAPILADALQDAGCDLDVSLGILRATDRVLIRGLWILDAILGKNRNG